MRYNGRIIKNKFMIYLITIFILLIIILILLNIGRVKRVVVYRDKQQKQKGENKEKILQELQSKNKITNNDIEKLLNVSDATATRYLEELEKENKIEQIGKTGRSVYYQLK
jgi:predicted HTH transcriptional regulator